ncbi:hypothetical protein ABH935_006808 [Catenulispora sp. GAS73]|uniref:hypothetical protein n=1 Tax=Catenulispora sp. GAS73 TaxID=3156269 RepID=UPI003516319D
MADENPVREKVEEEIKKAAREGQLSGYMAEHADAADPVLYRFVADVVFDRLTRRLERGRGHHRCAAGAAFLLPECHDRFQDDVEAALLDLLKHADKRIENLGGWIASRLNAVTVDANRKRRGIRGAQQRPRLPLWLRDALGGDPWLLDLALDVLTWVGVPNVAPGGLWPLGTWADRRAAATGDPGVTERQVAMDVERVLAAMKQNPAWFDLFVERPLGHKQAPLMCAPRTDGDAEREPDYVSCGGPDQSAEAELHELAARVIDQVEARLLAGDDPHAAVAGILTEVFHGGTGSDLLDRTPGSAPDLDERVARMIEDPEALARVTQVLLEILLEALAQDEEDT